MNEYHMLGMSESDNHALLHEIQCLKQQLEEERQRYVKREYDIQFGLYEQLAQMKVKSMESYVKTLEQELKDQSESFLREGDACILILREINHVKTIFKNREGGRRHLELEWSYKKLANLRERKCPYSRREEKDDYVSKVKEEMEAIYRDGVSILDYHMNKS